MGLLTNPAVLEQTFLPKLLPYREEQHKYLAECIKPLMEGRSGTNLLITGGVGIGKTACVRYILRMLMEETVNIMPIYINCWKRDSSPKIINDIADQMGIKTIDRISSDELFDMLIVKFSKYEGIVFAFDEIDKVKDFDFLYRILEDVPRKTIFLITNVGEWVAKVDRRLMSRLIPERIEFKPYKFEEIRGILYERQNYAFAPNSWEYDAFEIIIKNTFALNDLRSGLFLMKASGEIATSRNAGNIEIEDVNKALEKLNSSKA
ncbi:MAG: AAA family ATPase [Candidatus Aenigmatarchaeota archaeon]